MFIVANDSYSLNAVYMYVTRQMTVPAKKCKCVCSVADDSSCQVVKSMCAVWRMTVPAKL